ncbi:uncharacterized protein TNIN_415651 [Trichonephila inaurata madagascariensis]|uniref:Uncharacterized protein n=1 Tax=Trichonephila inaurata madagascariensis TaxID=2747483 RepID=A0A8X6XRW2_9ARAC|nr:uncharacterized protein TNIN_415651 [Trichonephila inaurata madagascariensis]
MAAKTESYFSAQLDPELLELIEKFSIETPELNIPDQSESKKTNILLKESSDNFHEQLNILYEEVLEDIECKILNTNNEINSVKTIEVKSETQSHTEKNVYFTKKETEKNDSCSQIESLDSVNENPKNLIDPNIDEKFLEDFKNLIIIEENSDSEEEKDIGEIKARGLDKQPKRNVRFHPISRSNWEIKNNVSAYELPYDYTSSITNNNIQFPQTNNINDPSFPINNNHFLNINNINLDSSSMRNNALFSEFDDIGVDSSWMLNNVHFSESQSVGLDSPCTNFDSPCTCNALPSVTKITGHCSLYVTHNNIQFSEKNKLASTSSLFDQNPYNLETGKINAFDDVKIVQNMKNLQSQTDLRHIDCNTVELRKDILQEDLQSKFLSVDEVEHVFENLSNTNSKIFSQKKSDLVYPQEQLLSIEIGKIKLNSLPELNQNCLFNTYGKNSNLDHQIRFNHARENYIPNFTSTSNKEDNSSCVNKDKENILFNNANYFLDKTDKNVNSSSNISDPTQNCKNLSPVVTNSSALSSTHELSEYDKTSLEIESKIRQLCTKRYLKEKPVSLPKNMSKYKQSVASNMSASVSCNHAQDSNRDSDGFEYRRLSCVLDTTAATKLLSSPSFDHDKQKFEEGIINQEIQRGLYGTEGKKVIHLLRRSRKTKNKKTNLHEAVLNGNVEKAYSIVEIQKKHHGSVEGINIRDSLNNKTALDYANLKGMDLLADYLRENLGHESVIVEPNSPLSTIGV